MIFLLVFDLNMNELTSGSDTKIRWTSVKQFKDLMAGQKFIQKSVEQDKPNPHHSRKSENGMGLD